MRLALHFFPVCAFLAYAACTKVRPVQPTGQTQPHPPDSVSVVASNPHNMSVLYSNQSSDLHTGWSERVGGVLYTHESHGEPGTAVITWLSPGTVHPGQWGLPVPGCLLLTVQHHGRDACPFYGPGFRTDTVQPYQRTCVHFVAPSAQVAVEFRITRAPELGGGGSIKFVRTLPNGAVAWSSDSSWGFDGNRLEPVGTVDSSSDNGKVWVRRVMQGC
jgi:hypothetical protein